MVVRSELRKAVQQNDDPDSSQKVKVGNKGSRVRWPQSTLSLLCTICSLLCTIRSLLCTICSLLCTIRSLLCTICSLLCTICSLLCTICSLLCTICSLLCTICSLPRTIRSLLRTICLRKKECGEEKTLYLRATVAGGYYPANIIWVCPDGRTAVPSL